jgi:hypothetical protein
LRGARSCIARRWFVVVTYPRQPQRGQSRRDVTSIAVKAPSPLLGFNNNVRHKGRVFHIQTEDSGVRHPHVITHLFADGGRILKTTKTSYAEHVGQDRLAETVRQMMQEQHKAMFIALRDGQFDHLFDESAQAKAAAPSSPGAAAPPAKPSSPGEPVARPPSPEPSRPEPPPPPPVPPVVERAPSPAPPPPESAPRSKKRPASRPKLEVDPALIHGATAPAMPQASIDLDLDALERAAAEAQTPFFQQIQDLPPPPAAVLGAKRPSPGGYSVRSPVPPTPPESGPQAAPNPRATLPRESIQEATPSASFYEPPRPHTSPRRTNPQPPPPPARYAPSRPASIFATTRPQEGSSIFGEDLISEKSLDEVILSYLAEDLDGPGDKK